MGQAADSFWLDILVEYRFSAGFLSVDRPGVVRRGDGGVVFVLLNMVLAGQRKKNRFKLWATATEKGGSADKQADRTPH